MVKKPLVSVLMPVYNGEKYLKDAIESILKQTYCNFEFLIINDGSTDRSVGIIQSYRDTRIRLVHNNTNIKVSATLNKGLDLAIGKYVVRMDCDDVALPERIEKQVKYMNENQNVVMCGSWMRSFGNGHKSVMRVPISYENIQCHMLFNNVIFHPTVILRLEELRDKGFYYNIKLGFGEDYELWLRIMTCHKIVNIPKVLLNHRIHDEHYAMNLENYKSMQLDAADKMRLMQLNRLGLYINDSGVAMHTSISCFRFRHDRDFIEAAECWLNKLYMKNKDKRIYSDINFKEVLGYYWFLVCNNNTCLGLWSWYKYWGSSLSKISNIDAKLIVKFLVKCLIKWHRYGLKEQ